MQFTTIAITLFALGASAMPASSETNNSIAKRTCGELKGTPLQICQGVCVGACDAISGLLLKKACQAACTKGPLKRSDETLTMEDVSVEDLIVLGHIHGDNDAHLAKRAGSSFGHEACIAGCEVLCNSTVLALAQTKCLATCKPKCS